MGNLTCHTVTGKGGEWNSSSDYWAPWTLVRYIKKKSLMQTSLKLPALLIRWIKRTKWWHRHNVPTTLDGAQALSFLSSDFGMRTWEYSLVNVYTKGNTINLPGRENNGGSCSTFVYSKTLSTEVIWFSNSVDWRIPHCSIPVSPIACVMASPTFPPVFSVGDKETMSVISLQLYIMGHKDIRQLMNHMKMQQGHSTWKQ